MSTRFISIVVCFLGLLIAFFATVAVAADVAERGELKGVVVSKGPAIDGTLSDPLWHACPELTLGQVSTNKPAEVKTTARVLFSPLAVYIAVTCEEPKMRDIQQTTVERDGSVWNDDCIEIFLNPNYYKNDYYHFSVNPKGTLFDQRCKGKHKWPKWNSSAVVKASTGPTAWIVTLAIPLLDLQAYYGDEQVWGLNITRARPKRGLQPGKEFSWAILSSDQFHKPREFGAVRHVSLPRRHDGAWHPAPAYFVAKPSGPAVTARTVAGKNYIWMEAENAEKIEPSFELTDDPDASQGQCLLIPENAGSGWSECGVGRAVFPFDAPIDGKYTLWARVKWEAGCSDAFLVYIDTLKLRNREGIVQKHTETLGKSTTFRTWHWYNRHVMDLKKGRHTLVLGNQDDGCAIDKMLITDDLDYRPPGKEEWCFNGDFENPRLDGWKIAGNSWSIIKQADKTGVLSKAIAAGKPAFLRDIHAGVFHLSLVIRHSPAFLIPFNYQDKDNYFLLQKGAGGIQVSRKKAGQKTVLGKSNPPRMASSGPARIELFREENRCVLLIDGKVALNADLPSPLPGMVGLDVAKGGTIDQVRLAPIDPIHFGCCFYSQKGYMPFELVSGVWLDKKGMGIPKGGNAVALIGEDWWRNYQVTCMVRLSKKGTLGIGFNYRDKDNYYLLELASKRQKLIARVNGKEKILAQALKADTDEDMFDRITINTVEGGLQVFRNGEQLFRVKNYALYAGKVMFAAQDAKKAALDDIEIWDLAELYDGKKSEPLRFFQDVPFRVIQSVWDNVSPTDEVPPQDGEILGVRVEKELAAVIGRKLKKTAPEQALVIDYQWLDFEEIYGGNCGFGKGPGWLTGEDASPQKNFYLWSIRNLYGDWDLRFKVQPKCYRFGVALQEWADTPTEGRHMAFTVNLTGRKFTLVQDGQTLTEKPLAISDWARDAWHGVHVWKKNGRLGFSAGGKTIFDVKDERAAALVKPAIFFSSGMPLFDNIEAWTYPSLVYNFNYNEPYSLALSDWLSSTPHHEIKHRGGYYSHLNFDQKDKQKTISLQSKRRFSGHFAAEITMASEKGHSFSVELKGAKLNTGYRCVVSEKDVSLFSGNRRMTRASIEDSSLLNVDLSTLRLWIKDGCLRFYLTDKAGSDRLVIKQTLAAPFLRQPFFLRISSLKSFQVRTARIWN